MEILLFKKTTDSDLSEGQEVAYKDEKKLIVAIKYSEHSNSFFIDFSNENGYIVSAKITHVVAEGIAKDLGLKITY